MRLLLDTHVFLWTLDDSPKLGKRARELMTARGTECYVSAVSFWEISIKAALRRRDFRVDPERLVEGAQAAGLRLLAFTPLHAVRVASLPRHHADPFDRALIAQSFGESLVFLTRDAALVRYGAAVRPI